DGTDIYFARQLVNERIQGAKEQLPKGIAPAMGPISTGLGEIYMWTVEAKTGAHKPDGQPYTPADLREIEDWIIKPQLRNVPGVTEINAIGGFAKQYQVAPKLDKLMAHGLTLADLVQVLERNNANVGAGYIERQGEQYLIRAPGQVRGTQDLGNMVIKQAGGVPIRIRDVADVGLGEELRTGAATENGREVVLGTVFMRIGENSRTVSADVDQKMAEINRTLPEGVHVVTVYNRTNLVDKAIATVKQNLFEGAVLVIAILFLFLGNLRAALITALVIPLSMLFTFSGMVSQKISANLMSLGALDFGIIVDGAVVIVENCVRRLAHAQVHHGRALTMKERFHEVFLAAQEARRPLLFGQLIIMIVYLPIFALSGVEGRMFHPMAFTVVTALLGAMVLSVTFIPAAVALFIGEKVADQENALMQGAKRLYAPLLKRVMSAKPVALTLAVVMVALSGLIASRMGSEFVPSLNEGDLALQSWRIPGTSLTQSVTMQKQLEARLKAKFPEIERVFTRTGTAEIATDPQGPNVSDGYLMLRPRETWPQPRKSRDELISAIEQEVATLPGQNYEFSQPVQMRVNELISGVRTDIALKLFGDDMPVLADVANQIAQIMDKVPGASDVKVEQISGLPMLSVNIDREKAARYGLNAGDIQETLATAVGGQEVGSLFEGDRRFEILVRLSESVRTNLDAIKRLPIPLSGRDAASNGMSFVPLSEVASVDVALGPNQISRDNGKRRIVISANVRGRDIGSFVNEAQEAMRQVKIPPGYWTIWGGQFENLQSARQRLMVVVPVSLLLVFTLLFAMFRDIKDGLLVFTGIPFALTGGVLALWARGIPLSISAAVGFIALSGVAVLNGLVMISFIRNLRDKGYGLDSAIEEGALTRLRPVLMTALVASLGFIPMAIATGTGAEVQRPLATVVIGGILSSTILTLLMLPVLYRLAHGSDEDEPESGPEVRPGSGQSSMSEVVT
ncbi:MAG: CusA/CzcA family heavy metal efflux RND transporter, partial [Burkholderiales bacterium]|nr:CusA/CzcA family heavy metal efflux RND transporter [Burkholderiales bacterium]